MQFITKSSLLILAITLLIGGCNPVLEPPSESTTTPAEEIQPNPTNVKDSATPTVIEAESLKPVSDLPVGTFDQEGELIHSPDSAPLDITSQSALESAYTHLVPFSPSNLLVDSLRVDLSSGTPDLPGIEGLYFFANGDQGEKGDDYRWGLVFIFVDENDQQYAAIAKTYPNANGENICQVSAESLPADFGQSSPRVFGKSLPGVFTQTLPPFDKLRAGSKWAGNLLKIPGNHRPQIDASRSNLR